MAGVKNPANHMIKIESKIVGHFVDLKIEAKRIQQELQSFTSRLLGFL